MDPEIVSASTCSEKTLWAPLRTETSQYNWPRSKPRFRIPSRHHRDTHDPDQRNWHALHHSVPEFPLPWIATKMHPRHHLSFLPMKNKRRKDLSPFFRHHDGLEGLNPKHHQR